jgi:hypothetical protein
MPAGTGMSANRRQFLRGAGGIALGLPFLPSLLERTARAASPLRPRLFWMGTDHGGCWDSNIFPDTSILTTQATATAGHTVASGPLVGTTANGVTTLSPVLSASSSLLTPSLIAKMNVLRGLDIPWYIGHNTGLHLGNYARNDNNGDDGAAVTALGARPTIDQIMANSSSFYTPSDLAGTTLQTMVINSGRQLSWGFSTPSQGVASAVQYIQGVDYSQQLFKSLFGNVTSGSSSMSSSKPMVDNILASYNSLRQGNARLSAADKTRLDAHIAMLSQLETSLSATLSCTAPVAPTDDANNHPQTSSLANAIAYGQLWADLVVAAFACGASRLGVFGWGDTSGFAPSYTGSDWHGDAAHHWFTDQAQAWLLQSYQGFFQNVLLYFASKLDGIDDGAGGTLLDSTLLVWTQESGMETHEAIGVPVITFGGASGFLNTGLYCDYRNVSETDAAIPMMAPTGYQTYPGLLYSQWLATALLAMGIPTSQFELWKDTSGNTEHGYGTPYLTADQPGWLPHYKSLTSPYFAMASTPLPFLQA